MTTAAVPGPDEHEQDDERELTVDELAARVGVTVRNLRAYSARAPGTTAASTSPG